MRSVRLILLLLCISGTIRAVDILRINNITDHNGLSQNTIRCLLEDSRGFIWLGTINGLNRYNGKEFMVANPETDDNSAPDNRIRSLTEDKNGFIWVRTFSNTMYCYDLSLEKFTDYDPSNRSKAFSDIRISSDGDVWLWGASGCCRVRYTNNKLSAWYANPANTENYPVSFVFEDSKSRIWIGCEDELLMVTDNVVRSVHRGARFLNVHEYENQLFFIADRHISVFDDETQSFLQDISSTLPKSQYKRSQILRNGILLIATNDDVYLLDAKNKSIAEANHFFQGKNSVMPVF